MNPLEKFKDRFKEAAQIVTPEIKETDNDFIYSKKCEITKEIYRVKIKKVDHKAWKDGAYIQDVARYLSDDEREFIISGTTPSEWLDMFGQEE